MTKNSKTTNKLPESIFNANRRMIILFGVAALIIVGILSGLLQYAAAYVGCGKVPVSTSKFAASYSYELPGEYGHGPSPFNGAYYCSQAEAEAAGYQHSPLTEGARLERAKENLEAY